MPKTNTIKPGPKKPHTKREWALYRVKAHCKIGRDALEGKGIVQGHDKTEYAFFCLLHAVEEIAEAMREDDSDEQT